MKTKLTTLFVIVFALFGSMYAQKVMNIYENGVVVYSTEITSIDSIKFEQQSIPTPPNTNNGHEYVDLGLSVKWATYNIGATAPEESGDYFAWGEVETKSPYNWGNYKYCNGSELSMTKYCTNSNYGRVDNLKILELTDDVAHVNWGGNWRMPTRAEQEELKNTNNCTWVWTSLNGVWGYEVTSLKNGNSIFLPAVGYYDYDGHTDFGIGRYWSSSLYWAAPNDAYYLFFNSSRVDRDGLAYFRYKGLSVRAVCDTRYTISVSSDEIMGTATASSTKAEKGASVTLTATPNHDYIFINWTVNGEVVSTENPYIATIASDVEFVANFIERYNGHEYVDLGLSVKWATCNIGATAPEEFGNYFAWGETEPKNYYDWTTYKYCNGTDDTMTKYCTNSTYGIVDNKTTLDLNDDAARINWGGVWRLPTKEEQEELRNPNNCTWTWTTQNGVNGYKVTSLKNGNSIFLPAAGDYYDDVLNGMNSKGSYWSSSLNTTYNFSPSSLHFNSGSVSLNDYYRCDGRSVRAVCE